MIEEIIIGIIKMTNEFPNKEGIDKDLSPDAIILGIPKIDCNNTKLTFWSYVNLHDETDNTMKLRAFGDIALRPSNEHDSYYVMSLRTGRRLNSSRRDKLPITDEVINKIKDMCKEEQQNMTKEDLTINDNTMAIETM